MRPAAWGGCLLILAGVFVPGWGQQVTPGLPSGFGAQAPGLQIPQQPANQQQTPAQPTPGQPQPAPAPNAPPTVYGGLSLNNVSLTEVIDTLARQLKLNYILDPRVRGGVILNTYGEIKDIDPRSLLETILRINGYGMVKQGDLYRIVPLNEISHLPIPPQQVTNPANIPEDDQTMLDLIFLKYVAADELAKVLTPFQGENASMYTYPPANLLLILDSRRNMRRLLELVNLFDSDTLANQRVHLYEVKNGRPTDLAKELDSIVKAIALNEKATPIKFLPVDRINTIIAVASNPGAFVEVEQWLARIDVPVKMSAGGVSNFVYRVKYGDAQTLGCSLMALYSTYNTYSPYGGGYNGGLGACTGLTPGGMGYGSGFGNLYSGPGATGFGAGAGTFGAFGNAGYGAAGFANNPYGAGAPYQGANPYPYMPPQPAATPFGGVGTPATGLPAGADRTGTFLGDNATTNPAQPVHIPKIIPNPFNNTILIQATPQEYESIAALLREMDVPPRQVLIEAKIYEVDLSTNLNYGVSSLLLQPRTTPANRQLTGGLSGGAVALTQGWLVDQARELMAQVSAAELQNKAKMISDPRVIATDSIPASVNVGLEVPTLTSTATAIQNGGVVANTIANRDTGATLQIVARVSPSGIVTMIINQEQSSPQGSGLTPSFQKSSVQTQVTVQDGDTVAIGGIITESNSTLQGGVPYLQRIPVLGAVFGNRSVTKQRSEQVIFLTPHVIYDTNQLVDASDELKANMRHLQKYADSQKE